MAEPIGPRITGLEHQVDDLRIAVERAAHNRNASNSTITVNAGGVGVWVATTACVVMLAVSCLMTFLYLDVRDEQRVTAAELHTIYVLVPELRKMVQDEISKNPR